MRRQYNLKFDGYGTIRLFYFEFLLGKVIFREKFASGFAIDILPSSKTKIHLSLLYQRNNINI